MTGTLVVCATPIGNLDDISKRLASTLADADIVYAEDTRRTAKLLNHIGVSVPMRSFFAGNERARLADLADELRSGLTIAIVSDAGMPVVSDPGASAVSVAWEVGARISAIPGPSAVVTALAVSGFSGDRFVFEGFLPRKGKERKAVLKGLSNETRTVVLFCAPSRAGKDLSDIASVVGDRQVVVTRELTKLHEEVWRGAASDAANEFDAPDRARGEFTIVVEGGSIESGSLEEATSAALHLIGEGATTSDAVRDSAAAHGVSRRELYDEVLRNRS